MSTRLLAGSAKNFFEHCRWYGWCSGSIMLCKLYADVAESLTEDRDWSETAAFEIVKKHQDTERLRKWNANANAARV